MKLKNQYLFIVCIGVVFFIQACSEPQNNNSENNIKNELLAEKVIAAYPLNDKNILNKEGVGNYMLEPFIEELFKVVYAKEISISDYDYKPMNPESIKEILNYEDDLKEVKELGFEEEWDYNKNTLIFNKIVTIYFPIRVYYEPEDYYKKKNMEPGPLMRKVFLINNKSEGNFNQVLAKDIIYEIPHFAPYPSKGLDAEKFCEYLIKNVISGELKAYDPTFLINLKPRELSKQEIDEITKINQVCEYADLFIFHEDWMYDSESMSIKKIVKGIALAGWFNIDEQWQKKTLFYIPLKN